MKSLTAVQLTQRIIQSNLYMCTNILKIAFLPTFSTLGKMRRKAQEKSSRRKSQWWAPRTQHVRKVSRDRAETLHMAGAQGRCHTTHELSCYLRSVSSLKHLKKCFPANFFYNRNNLQKKIAMKPCSLSVR